MTIGLHFAASFGFENMATLALAVNLVTYFNGTMHFDVADAANELTNFMGTSYIITILVAVLADSCLGRLKAVVVSGCLEFAVSTLFNEYIELIYNIDCLNHLVSLMEHLCAFRD